MTKSVSPTVRALDELKRFHETECQHIQNEEYLELESQLSKIKQNSEKSAVDSIVQSIEALPIPYKLDHRTLCNIRNWDGNLKFSLTFVPAKNKESAPIDKQMSKIIQNRRNAEADLEQWYIKSLYDIAGRSNVTEFKVKTHE